MAKSFELQMKEFENMTTGSAEFLFRQVCFDLSDGIITNTPIDSGRAKGNWQPDINRVENSQLDTEDKSGRKTIAKVEATTNKLQLGQYFTLTNNLDYIEKLEFGLYPNPVKKGSPIKGTSNPVQYEILTSGGFSKKSPAGMVGVTTMKFQHIVSQNIKEIKK